MLARGQGQKDREVTLNPRRGDIVDRSGRVLAISVDAESVYADPSEVENPAELADAVCGALGDCSAEERGEYAQAAQQEGPAPGRSCARQVSPEEAAREARAEAPGHLHQASRSGSTRTASWRRTCSAMSAGQPGSRRHRAVLRLDRSAACRAAVIVQVDARRERVQPGRAAAGPGRHHRAHHRRASPAHRRARAASWASTKHRAEGGTVDRHGSAHRRDPRDGQRADVQPERLPGLPARTAENRAVQDVYEPGSTFKIVTASAAIEEHVFAPTDLIDVSAGVWRSGSRGVTEAKNHNYGVLSFTDVHREVEQRRRHQDRPRRRRRAAGPLRAAVRLRPDACSPDLPGETRRHRLADPSGLEPERAGVGVDGLPDRRHAAADGGGRQRRSPTAACWWSRASCARSSATADATRSPPHDAAARDQPRTRPPS